MNIGEKKVIYTRADAILGKLLFPAVNCSCCRSRFFYSSLSLYTCLNRFCASVYNVRTSNASLRKFAGELEQKREKNVRV